ncbi:alpha/beta hydrolase [Streptomyces sp. GESEQ-35]|uniref:alpha/beta hydrolase n=1 Tax=Streptomyces sp. GESEQ-35 TaxID=2812657 RepID=UPI001B34031F|nr:alpha/beta hydrolase [Streptomyces sp. GESEQ-35]
MTFIKSLAAVASSVLIAGYGAPAHADDSAEPTTAAPTSTIDWTTCPGTTAVQCATIEVPLDWSDPGGEKIHLGLARHQATDPDQRIGSLVLDPGGPGMSGVADMTARNGQVATAAVLERFDVVTYDPRGVYTSSLITCDQNMVDATEALKDPHSQADFDKLVAAKVALSEDCRRRTGPLYDHTDTIHTVHDIDAIRAALGEDRISQIGDSYGTLATQLYAQMYPDRVRALVGDGNMDHHNVRTAWDWMSAGTGALEENFLQFAAWCDTTPDCALYGRDTKKTYGELRERARKGELTDPTSGSVISFAGLTATVFGANFPEAWTGLAGTIKALYDGEATPPPPTGDPWPPGVPRLPQEVWLCQDFDLQVSNYAEWKLLSSQLARKYPNVQWSPYANSALNCVGYTGETTYPQAPPDTSDAPPMVMLGNVHDYATVYSWSQAAARDTGATLVTYEGYGHTVYPATAAAGPSTCINDVIDEYLINLEVPATGTSCPDIQIPGGV